jgi:hypothetical protein
MDGFREFLEKNGHPGEGRVLVLIGNNEAEELSTLMMRFNSAGVTELNEPEEFFKLNGITGIRVDVDSLIQFKRLPYFLDITTVTDEMLDDKIDEWHNNANCNMLHDYLGMTWSEYGEWVRGRRK